MKRLQLPKNKFARFFINLALIIFWFFFSAFIYAVLYKVFLDAYLINFLGNFLDIWTARIFSKYPASFLIMFFIPSFIFTRFIWFGRILPRPRITRSKD